MPEIHIQRLFFDNKKGIQKIVVLKSKQCEHALVHLLHTIFLFIGGISDLAAMVVANNMPSFEKRKKKTS
jgi:hypothetical protein